ncbi:MAG: hypothetical protein V3T58_00695 [Candidatus Hydrothermarchaeales archaeon]
MKIMPPGIKLPDDIEFVTVEEEVEEKKVKPAKLEESVEEMEELTLVVDEI